MEVLTSAVKQEKVKGNQIGKKEVKWSLFADDIILQIESSKNLKTNKQKNYEN